MDISSPKYVLQDILKNLLSLNSDNPAFYSFALYSAASIYALTSLYDFDSSSDGVTEEHIKRKIFKITQALNADQWFTNLIQDNLQTSDLKTRSIDDVIFSIYRNAGYFYEKSGRLYLPEYREATVNGISFIRGTGYQKSLRMSGAGIFRKVEEAESDSDSLREMFLIPDRSNHDLFNDFITYSKFEKTNARAFAQNIEYL